MTMKITFFVLSCLFFIILVNAWAEPKGIQTIDQ